MVALFTSRQVVAQTKSVPITEQFQPRVKGEVSLQTKVSSIQVTGLVKFAEDSTALPGVNVIRKGTTEGTATDEGGKFSLTLNDMGTNNVLVFSFIGFETVEYTLDPTKPVQNISIAMTADYTQLGETIVVGGMVATRWYSPRRWWWGIKGLFRK